MHSVTIVGAGMAGCEAALQLAAHGYNVTLYDSKPQELLATYKLSTYAELVCNNSLGSNDEKTPLGLLLKELRMFRSKMIDIAEKCCINDPYFFSVDKKFFSQAVTDELYKHKITIINKHISSIPKDDNIIIATGPLTNELLLSALSEKYGIEEYHFSDASSPIVDIRTVNINNNNIEKITDDLYAVSMSLKDFQGFYHELRNQTKQTSQHSIGKNIDFVKCQSIEELAKIGIDELRLKRFSYDFFESPCLLLRRENALENGFILVGCITKLRYSEQKIVFSRIPGFENCRFIKFGRMHRNTFFNSPKYLNEFFQLKNTSTYIIGQLSGVDGYAPAIASGLVASLRIIYGKSLLPFPVNTMIGGLARYISNSSVTDFQPMCASFSLLKNE